MTARDKTVATNYLGRLLDRHGKGVAEANIGMAFRDFLIQTGIASDPDEILLEEHPVPGSRSRVDLYIRNTYVEFKRDVIKSGSIDQGYISQLDKYILANAQAGNGIQNGILTDGKNYLKRSVGDDKRALVVESGHVVFETAQQGDRLYEYLFDIVDTQAENITPSDEMLTKYLGQDSDVFKTATTLLRAAHDAHRETPTVSVKRNL